MLNLFFGLWKVCFMREVTKEMIKLYDIKKLGYDFMGYNFDRLKDLSFHHLIVPYRDCKKQGLGEGYLIWNGAILVQDTAHEYLHTIERLDRELFLRITKYMIEENRNGKIDIDNLKRIRGLLLYFENEHKNETNKKGKQLIKREYITDRIKL